MRYLIALFIFFLSTVAFADNLPSPPPLTNQPSELQHYLKEIADNFNQLQVVTSTPDGSRRGQKGDMVLLQDGDNFICINVDSNTDWDCHTFSGGSGGSGAPLDVDYLVKTADSTLTAEIAVGATDDTTIVANGTTWVSTTLPNCTDTGGNHLNYTQSSNSFSCGTTGDGSATGDVTDVGDCASGACFQGATGSGTQLVFKNATSGLLTLKTVTGALGTVTQSLPARTATIVNGPSSATDNMAARWDGTSGNLIQDSSIFISDAGDVGHGTITPSTSLDIEDNSSDDGIDINNTSSVGGTSGLFPGGTKADHVVIPDGNSVDTTGDWTIEGHVRFAAVTNTYHMFMSAIDGPGTPYVQIMFKGVDHFLRIATNVWSEGSGNAKNAPWFPAIDTWYHWAICYNDTTDILTMFIGGTLQTTASESSNIPDLRNIDIKFGADETEGRQLNGWMDDVRISDNVRYTGSFRPPDAPLQSDANTLVLLKFDGVDGAETTTDSSPLANTVTMSGDTVIDSAQSMFDPESGDARIKFQSSGTTKFTVGMDGLDSQKFKIGTTALDTDTRLTIESNGRVGIGESVPTARLHITSGTSSTSGAPLKLESGSLLSTTEDGAVEYDGTHFYGTVGTTRYPLDQINSQGTQFSFKNIAVTGQTSVVADATEDTVTLIAGTGITLTTNATNDTVTISCSP